MIDEEVESVLREIRERVISQPVADRAPDSATALQNGDGKPPAISAPVSEVRHSQALARLQAHLTTTARAWDRLPPIFSNRSGTAARIELWIKARLKVFSRWFTWEQVNFNAAVHHALGEAVEVLAQQETAIAATRAQLSQTRDENQALREELQSQRAVVEAQSAALDSLREKLQAETAARHLDLQNLNAWRAETRGEFEALGVQAEVQAAELRAELSLQADELREGNSLIQNEQRVCYKQLSLEANEIATAQDRAQRQTRASLDEINQRLTQLETSVKRPTKP